MHIICSNIAAIAIKFKLYLSLVSVHSNSHCVTEVYYSRKLMRILGCTHTHTT